jgi:hypothetical protein
MSPFTYLYRKYNYNHIHKLRSLWQCKLKADNSTLYPIFVIINLHFCADFVNYIKYKSYPIARNSTSWPGHACLKNRTRKKAKQKMDNKYCSCIGCKFIMRITILSDAVWKIHAVLVCVLMYACRFNDFCSSCLDILIHCKCGVCNFQICVSIYVNLGS